MFHKRSTNVPTSKRNETKRLEFAPESAPSKEHISIWSRRAESVQNKTNPGTIPTRFGFVSKTISKRLSFHFLHYYTLQSVSSVLKHSLSVVYHPPPPPPPNVTLCWFHYLYLANNLRPFHQNRHIVFCVSFIMSPLINYTPPPYDPSVTNSTVIKWRVP